MNWIVFPFIYPVDSAIQRLNNIKAWVDWGTVTVNFLAQAEFTVTQLRLELQPLDLESSTLSIRPACVPL